MTELKDCKHQWQLYMPLVGHRCRECGKIEYYNNTRPSDPVRVENEWQPIELAPTDGSPVIGCSLGPWPHNWSPGMSPQTIRYRTYHPNSPGKKVWRYEDGRPAHPTHYKTMPMPPAPED
jgi:hypothetical protein